MILKIDSHWLETLKVLTKSSLDVISDLWNWEKNTNVRYHFPHEFWMLVQSNKRIKRNFNDLFTLCYVYNTAQSPRVLEGYWNMQSEQTGQDFPIMKFSLCNSSRQIYLTQTQTPIWMHTLKVYIAVCWSLATGNSVSKNRLLSVRKEYHKMNFLNLRHA